MFRESARRGGAACVIVNSSGVFRGRSEKADPPFESPVHENPPAREWRRHARRPYVPSPRGNSNDKMAPRRKSIQTSRRSLNDVCYKENNYLCCLNDYQTRVRRRESLRHARSHAVSTRRPGRPAILATGASVDVAFKGHFAPRLVDLTLPARTDSHGGFRRILDGTRRSSAGREAASA